MKWSIRVGRVGGIDVYFHVTFVMLVAALLFLDLANGAPLDRALAGVGSVLALFGCVFLHELGHAAAARRYGIRTRDITLLPIGGVSSLERLPERPREELRVALAGPAVNVALAALLFLALVTAQLVVDVRVLQVVGGPFLGKLLAINLSVAAFNLLPAFPMDGGRVLRALLAMRMERPRATRLAARLVRLSLRAWRCPTISTGAGSAASSASAAASRWGMSAGSFCPSPSSVAIQYPRAAFTPVTIAALCPHETRWRRRTRSPAAVSAASASAVPSVEPSST